MKKLLILCLLISLIGCGKQTPKDPINIINEEREIYFPL